MKAFLVILICILSTRAMNAQQLAFPTAEGFGAFSKGGRGGKVMFVENLNDSGSGSLRHAIDAKGPRVVIFRVSGTIELKSRLIIESPYITIAGQTAPGDGICLKHFPLEIIGAHDVIVRSIRVRPGIDSGLPGDAIDGISIRNSKNVIIDHCSASWSVDEILNTNHHNEDLTVQWSIFSEPLNNSIHHKGPHGFAATIGGVRTSYHHNLFAHAPARNPSIGGSDKNRTEYLDFRNNVVFNWGHRSCDGKPLTINFVGNYYKSGPATNQNVRQRLVRIDNSGIYGYNSIWHIEGNVLEGYPMLSKDNWNGAVEFEKGTSMEGNRRNAPFDNGNYKTQDPKEAYKKVLRYAGAIAPCRDKVDERIIAEVRSGKPTIGNGIIDRVEQAGGWPLLKSSPPPVDSDNDGMPDFWEIKHGLNPNDPEDRNGDFNGDGYTNLEKYLNGLMYHMYK